MQPGSKQCFAAVLLTVLAGAGSMQAATVTANLGTLTNSATNIGTFANQAEVFEATFSLSSASKLTIFTTSYGGGNNLSGAASTAGGFQPMITLFTGTGNYVTGQQVTSPIAQTDPVTKLALDQYLFDANVGPGNYIAVLTDWLNQQPPSATNLSDGFVSLGSGGSTFVDEQFNTRTANYALNLSATPLGGESAVPEPATFGLILPALAGAAFFLRNKKKVSGENNG
jgi:PEP-CTERM motif-containing protein